MSNGFIYVVDAHFIDKIEGKTILDPSACGKYCRLLTITGNVALKAANVFARIHQRVSHEVFSSLSPSFPQNSYSNLSIFRRVLEGEFDYLHSNHHGPYWYIWWECTIAKLKTYALECTYCAIRIRSLLLAWTPLWIPDMFAVPSYPYALGLSINYMPNFTRLVKTAQQDFHR